MNLKAGDKLKRVSGLFNIHIIIGEVYTFKEWYYEPSDIIILEEIGGRTWHLGNFELVESEEKEYV